MISKKKHLAEIQRLNEEMDDLLFHKNRVDDLLDEINRIIIKSVDGIKMGKSRAVKERADKFALDVVKIGEELKTNPNLIIEFVDYWTEMNKGGTKFKAEMQQTFDIKRRLNKWIKNDKEWATKEIADLLNL